MEKILFILLILIVSVSFLFEQLVDYLNSKHWCSGLPDSLKSIITIDQYEKSIKYYKENENISRISEWFSFVLLITALLLGFFGWLNDCISQYTTNYIFLPLLFFGFLGFISAIISLPFEVYSTFVIEERFGFNKTTVKLYILDKLKGILLAIIIGGGIMSLILYIYHSTGEWFWILALAVITLFSIFFSMFYSTLIVPLFNKQKPLEEGETRSAIEGFAKKVGFKLDNIFVIDGSKRSTKANAYFSGLGKKKRIVLYDTLISTHTTSELVAVLAHEIGHYKHKHIQKGMAISILETGVMLYLLSRFIDPTTTFAKDMCLALGSKTPNFHIGILAFGILYSPISSVLSSFSNKLSRYFEFQADRYAGMYSNAADLQTALKRLSVDHLSNLNPHPLYVYIHYSHPPLILRLEGLEKVKDELMQ
jgi:STE24 endopeptidase